MLTFKKWLLGIEMQMQRTDLWTQRMREMGWDELREYHWHICTTTCEIESW